MVTPIDSESEEIIAPPAPEVPPIETGDEGLPPNDGQPPVVDGPPEDVPPVPVEASQPVQSPQVQAQGPTPDVQVQLRELQSMRQVNAQKEWEQKTMREAQSIERRMAEQGMDPQNARQVARQHLTSRKELRDQEGKALSLIEEVEGKHNAALHMLNKHGLANKQTLDDLKSLLAFTTPDSMDREAQRMSTIRKQSAEIARLRQGQVAPQTFDNSQGAAEASSNDGRLLDAYNNGDRSEAAVRAARRFAFGS